jgi:hypothetical protein
MLIKSQIFDAYALKETLGKNFHRRRGHYTIFEVIQGEIYETPGIG